jgi:hypothetical protein
MDKKILIFDASPIITLTMTGLLEEFKRLRDSSNVQFIITKEVHSEIVERPSQIKRFELEAIKAKDLISKGYLEFPEKVGVSDRAISELTKDVLNLSNKAFKANGKDIHLIDLGEASCLALSKILRDKGIENVTVIDERTTRMLCEAPEKLGNLLQKKLHSKITWDKKYFDDFDKIKIIRSAELMYLAYKKDLLRLKGKEVLEAVLYAVQFKGCSIPEEEIKEIVRKG